MHITASGPYKYFDYALVALLVVGVGCDKKNATKSDKAIFQTAAIDPFANMPKAELVTRDPISSTYGSPELPVINREYSDYLDKYSQKWKDKAAEIESKVRNIQDPTLKENERKNLWNSVKDKSEYYVEADNKISSLQESYRNERTKQLLTIDNKWWLCASCSGFGTEGFTFNADTTYGGSYFYQTNYISVTLGLEQVDKILTTMKQIIKEDVDNYNNQYKNSEGHNLAVKISEGDYAYAGGKIISDPVIRNKFENEIISTRLSIAAQGSFTSKRIDKYAIIDAITGIILAEPQKEKVTWSYDSKLMNELTEKFYEHRNLYKELLKKHSANKLSSSWEEFKSLDVQGGKPREYMTTPEARINELVIKINRLKAIKQESLK